MVNVHAPEEPATEEIVPVILKAVFGETNPKIVTF